MSTPVVLITGALTGIGRATAFAREGTSLVVAGRHDDVAVALANELRALGTDVESTMPAPEGKARSRDGADIRQLRGNVRHHCARNAAELETRNAAHAAAKQWHHRQHFLDQ
jgi:NAD(P)-dependent dehydrogenase (short-subunit alcohol dehydrogenase family)